MERMQAEERESSLQVVDEIVVPWVYLTVLRWVFITFPTVN
jgi:hypothetical protein